MKKSVKRNEVLGVYNLLNAAKLGAIEDNDEKFKVILILRVLKPVANGFEDFRKDAVEKLKPEGYDDKILVWNECSEKLQLGVKSDKLPMSAEEFVDMTYKVIKPFNTALNNLVEKEAEKEVELEFEPISEDSVMKLGVAHDWNVGQIDMISGLVCGGTEPAEEEPKKGKKK